MRRESNTMARVRCADSHTQTVSLVRFNVTSSLGSTSGVKSNMSRDLCILFNFFGCTCAHEATGVLMIERGRHVRQKSGVIAARRRRRRRQTADKSQRRSRDLNSVELGATRKFLG